MTKLMQPEEQETVDVRSMCVGRVVKITDKGHPLVDFPLNQAGPVEARSTTDAYSKLQGSAAENRRVLLAFDNSDPSLPIIVGIIQDNLVDNDLSAQENLPAGSLLEIAFDGKTVALRASEEILLRCGTSSITLRKDGKIILKGTQIVSRASRTHKIKGAQVMIN
jgi:hypothetical protein